MRLISLHSETRSPGSPSLAGNRTPANGFQIALSLKDKLLSYNLS